MGADNESLKRFMRSLPQGVTIITMRAGEVAHGMTASSVAGLSMDPPLFLVCVDHAARAHDILKRAEHFAVNVLSANQADICMVFAKKELSDEERWATVTTHDGETGAPLIDGCISYLECRVVEALPGGDHTIYLGEPVAAAEGTPGSPLVLHEQKVRGLD